MTKQEEISILQSLKGDTYFAQIFGDDIDKMCENISVDFAIESGCKFFAKIDALQKALDKQKKHAEKTLLSFAHEIIIALDKGSDATVYQSVEGGIGIEEIIKFKHSQNMKLSDREINYLVGKLI